MPDQPRSFDGCRTKVVFASLLVGVLFAGSPSPALAHAGLVAANPPPGIGIPQAPGEVVLRFSEPLNFDLSRIEVLDESGRPVTVGPALPVEGDPRAMRRSSASSSRGSTKSDG